MDIQEKFDRVLERVKDPESELPLANIGIVQKFRYNDEKKVIYVFTTFAAHRPSCMTCVGITMAIESTLQRLLEEALLAEFPGFSVEFVPA
ncbi:MAG TPA: hypothetical protein ENN41_10070 [Sediminispirochaeta sp.]|nr:hypothetical protein [Sediminispirochaeta sp.]